MSNDIKMIAFKIITDLAKHVGRDPANTQELKHYLRCFFQRIFEFIFTEVMKDDDVMMRENIAFAMYFLIHCYSDTYRDIVREVLRSLGDTQAEEAIATALFQIVDDMGTGFPVNKRLFVQKFDEFLKKINIILGHA